MKNSIKQNLATYDATASTLIDSYNTIHAPDIFPAFVETLLQHPTAKRKQINILNIGCGTGRDSKWIADQGFNGVAVDGSKKMLELAQKHNNHKNIKYICDIAPALDKTHALKKRFDIVLIHAFLFHLDKEDRQKFYGSLETLTKDDLGRKDIHWDHIALEKKVPFS